MILLLLIQDSIAPLILPHGTVVSVLQHAIATLERREHDEREALELGTGARRPLRGGQARDSMRQVATCVHTPELTRAPSYSSYSAGQRAPARRPHLCCH